MDKMVQYVYIRGFLLSQTEDRSTQKITNSISYLKAPVSEQQSEAEPHSYA